MVWGNSGSRVVLGNLNNFCKLDIVAKDLIIDSKIHLHWYDWDAEPTSTEKKKRYFVLMHIPRRVDPAITDYDLRKLRKTNRKNITINTCIAVTLCEAYYKYL